MVSNPLTDPEWADRSVDLIDRVVATVRRYTTQPIVATARGLVFGLLAAFGIIGVIVVLGIGITRGLQAALDAAMPRDAAVWASSSSGIPAIRRFCSTRFLAILLRWMACSFVAAAFISATNSDSVSASASASTSAKSADPALARKSLTRFLAILPR